MIKTTLVVIAIILTCVGIYFSHDLLYTTVLFLTDHPITLVSVVAAVVVQLVGHWFRAKRTELILDQAALSSTRFQFGALGIGYLFNDLLPLRLGEPIRSLLIARHLHISFLYTFVAVIIERAIDVIFLSVLLLVGAFVIKDSSGGGVLLITTIALLTAAAILYCLLLIKNENKYLLSFISWLTGLFNASISNKLRFKIWSLIFGLQNFFNNLELVRRYILYACISWFCYFVSAGIVVIVLLHPMEILQTIATSVSPYVISFNPVDAGSYLNLVAFLPERLSGNNFDIYAKVIWVILTLPMAIIGLAALFLYKQGSSRTAKKVKADPYVNKLLRHEDISQEFPVFLETYFKGYSLSHILHKIELTGELSLMKFFKGGSDAITVLAMRDEKLFVKKIVPAEHTERLRAQYKWLKKHASKKQIVDVLGEHKMADYYAIDLSYNPEHVSLFEYIHTHSLAQAKKAIDEVWQYVKKNIYALEKESVNTNERDEYIEERLMKKMKSAVAVNDDLQQIIDEKKIRINGEIYDNFYVIMDKIKNHKQAWQDLAVYRKSSAIHGDLTVDNILIDTGDNKPFLIDPSDDNQIRGPIIDFARHTQSLIAGYEFLNSDDEPVKAKMDDGVISINYHDRRSAQYMQLNDYFQSIMAAKYLTETERKTVLFHTGLLFGRMLAHRVLINPHNTLKYYAVSVVLLNNFYRQYK